MCGLWGFCGSKPDQKTLLTIAQRAGTRGPHAVGWAWKDAGGAMRVEKRLGVIKPHLQEISSLTASVIVGHARLATSGTPGDPANNQPLVDGDTLIAHNGTVHDPFGTAETHGLHLETDCDSEVLLRLLQQGPPDPAAALQQAFYRIDRSVPHAILAVYGGALLALQGGHPLYGLERPEGWYFCSRSFEGASPLSGALALSVVYPKNGGN